MNILAIHINNFGPFQADVWGTVSDWTAVFVYSVTGFLIYKTLNGQNKILQLEQTRFLNSQIPIFEVKKWTDSQVLPLPNSKFDFFLFFTVNISNGNSAKNLLITHDNNPLWISNLNPKQYSEFLPGMLLTFKMTATLNGEQFNNRIIASGSFCVTLIYEDQLSNKYAQMINYVRLDDIEQLIITHPLSEKKEIKKHILKRLFS